MYTAAEIQVGERVWFVAGKLNDRVPRQQQGWAGLSGLVRGPTLGEDGLLVDGNDAREQVAIVRYTVNDLARGLPEDLCVRSERYWRVTVNYGGQL